MLLRCDVEGLGQHNFVQASNYDIIFITESWLKPKILDALICPPGFVVMRKDRLDKRGGGILVLIKDHINVLEVNLVNTPIVSKISDDDIITIEYLCVDVLLSRSYTRSLFSALTCPRSVPIIMILSNASGMIGRR